MNETFVFARQNSVCAQPYQYYQCSKGPFEGCCAVNPCDDGICREEDQPPSSAAAADDGQSQTTILMTTKTIMLTASVTSTTVLGEITSAASVATTTLVTSAGDSVVTETAGVPTSTAVKNGVSTSTSSSHKGAIIGGAIGGVMGAVVLLLGLYLWYRKRKALKISTSWGSNEKEVRNRSSAGFQVNSDYTSSSSWTGPFEHYNDSK